MPMLFLNEKSWNTTCSQGRAEQAMADFAEAVHAVAKEDRPGTSLVSEVAVKSLEIIEGYPVGKWIDSSPRNRALWQRLRLVQNRSPVHSVYPMEDATGHLEYHHDGEPVLGLGAAHFMDGIAVSLPVETQWQSSSVRLDRTELVEDEDGVTDLRKDSVDVRHLSDSAHADEHRTWIKKEAQGRANTGTQIWDRRADLYPHLQFLPHVADQLQALDPRWIVPVRRSLERLDAAAAAWDPATAPEPDWQSKVTPEGETRKRVCRFEDLDGQWATFHLHARFTPGAGRIHFRLIGEEGKIRVAHIGGKIRPDL